MAFMTFSAMRIRLASVPAALKRYAADFHASVHSGSHVMISWKVRVGGCVTGGSGTAASEEESEDDELELSAHALAFACTDSDEDSDEEELESSAPAPLVCLSCSGVCLSWSGGAFTTGSMASAVSKVDWAGSA